MRDICRSDRDECSANNCQVCDLLEYGKMVLLILIVAFDDRGECSGIVGIHSGKLASLDAYFRDARKHAEHGWSPKLIHNRH